MQAEFAAALARITAAIQGILAHANDLKPLVDLVTEAIPKLHDLAQELENALGKPPAPPASQ